MWPNMKRLSSPRRGGPIWRAETDNSDGSPFAPPPLLRHIAIHGFFPFLSLPDGYPSDQDRCQPGAKACWQPFPESHMWRLANVTASSRIVLRCGGAFYRPLPNRAMFKSPRCSTSLLRKIRAPIKIKSALPPPPPPKKTPQKRGILRTWFFLQKERIFPGVHKIGAAISGPRIADTNFTDTRIFLTYDRKSLAKGDFLCD